MRLILAAWREPPHPFDAAVRDAFAASEGNVMRVAREFGVSRSTAYRWRQRLGIRRDRS